MAKRASKKSGRSRRWPPRLLARLRGVRHRMAEDGLDALLVVHPPDIHYLTGFSGEDSWAVVKSGSVVVLSDGRFKQELEEQCPYVRSVIRHRTGLSEELAKVVKRSKIGKIGLQAEHLTLAQRRAIVKPKPLRAGMLTETTGWLAERRAVKDEAEVKAIRRAISIQERAYRDTLSEIGPGMTEREVAARLEYHMRARGADGPSFPTIVASGANASIPHYVPGDAKVRKNTPLLIDFGAQRDGYCGDLTRVVSFGKMSKRMAGVYEVVREAQLAAIEAIEPGRELVEVDKAARDVIEGAGYGERFGHGLGHGIGLEVHEGPRLSPRGEGELEAGHVVTLEPGIYLPGVGGVRIEDDVLVTDRGRRKLSRLPTDLESAMIGG